MSRRTYAGMAIAGLLLGASLAAAGQTFILREPTPEQRALQAAVAAPHRSEAFRARDVYRHPAETLDFFEVRPDLSVVEIWPGTGWYTEILAPLLRERGRYTAAGFVTGEDATEYRRKVDLDFRAKLAAAPALYDRVQLTELGMPDRWAAVPAGSADRVLTFRNVHNWIAGHYEQSMFDAFYAALKPGGLLGVVEHRARPGTDLEKMRKSGYVTEAYVKELAQQAGFVFIGAAEINANPADTTDHPEGVWTLPPTLRLGVQDRAKYLAIGESDRMTLKFMKPVKK